MNVINFTGNTGREAATKFLTDGTAVTTFSGPEHNREKVRRAQTKMSPKATNDMLSILRTGGGI